MADESFRSKLYSCGVVTFLVLYFAVFVSFTIVQVRKTQDLEVRLEERRLAVRNLSLKCNEHSEDSKKKRIMRSIQNLAKEDERFTEMLKMVEKRQSSSFSSLMQDLLHAQEQILLKTCTPDTVICLPGSKGEPGFRGVAGSIGPKGGQGTEGQDGDQGVHGSDGEKGAPGPTGDKGVKGDPGSPGKQGVVGDTGNSNNSSFKGLKGEPGPVGLQGDPGDPGEKGDIGLKGELGLSGAKGDIGPIGPIGPKGFKGDSGLKGSTPSSTEQCDCIKAPGLSLNETTINAQLGSSVTLNCSSDVQPTPSVTWYKHDDDGCFKNNSGNVGSVLTIDPLQPVDLGTYTCILSNMYGTISRNITVETTDPTDVFKCDFENGLCLWKQTRNDDIDWLMGNGDTFTSGTGPSVDHTIGNDKGHYIYLMASNSSRNEKARLEHLMIPSDNDRCLSFWFNMYGSQIGSLSILAEDCNGTQYLLWTKSGNQGQRWQNAKITIPKSIHGQKIIIEASRGNGIFGDIAIDDTMINNTQCAIAKKPPVFLTNNELFQLSESDTATLNCSVSGYPPPAVSWSKLGACHPQNISAVQGESWQLVNASVSDSGIYKCSATNSLGTVEKYIQVVVNDTNTCTFDVGTSLNSCGWNQVSTSMDTMDWSIRKGPTPSSDTGPSDDHTQGNGTGQYMFMEASGRTRKEDDTARLQSVLLPAGFNFCMKLWYNMYGSEIGSLKIIQQSCKTQTEKTLWQQNGNQGTKWLHKCVEVNRTSDDFYLIIEGVRGPGIHSDIAIDDITLKMAKQCDCAQATRISCTFDTDLCGWTQGTTDDFDWERHSDDTATIDTGPISDHTSGNGYYMYIETSNPQVSGQTAQLRSPDLSGGIEYCLDMAYSMFGSDIGDLDIYTQVVGSSKVNVYHKQGNQGMDWHTEKIHIPKQIGTFKVLIEATKGPGFYSDIAIDDVTIVTGQC